jgi:hypothetical protein
MSAILDKKGEGLGKFSADQGKLSRCYCVRRVTMCACTHFGSHKSNINLERVPLYAVINTCTVNKLAALNIRLSLQTVLCDESGDNLLCTHFPLHHAQSSAYVCHSKLQADPGMFPRDSSVTTIKTRISSSCNLQSSIDIVFRLVMLPALPSNKQGVVNYRQDRNILRIS